MIAIGGSIGTALFVSIGYGLIEGGPGNLLLGFTIYSVFLSLVNSCVAEMTVYMPVSGGFVRLGGKVSLRGNCIWLSEGMDVLTDGVVCVFSGWMRLLASWLGYVVKVMMVMWSDFFC